MTFMPATLGRSDDLRKLPWSCLALRTQDGVGPTPSVAILCGSMQGKTVKAGQVDTWCRQVCAFMLSDALGQFAAVCSQVLCLLCRRYRDHNTVLRQRLPTWLSLPFTGASNLRIWPTTLLQPLACRGISP